MYLPRLQFVVKLTADTWKENLLNVMDNPVVGWMKTGRKLIGIDFHGLTVFRVNDILFFQTEAGWMTVTNKLLKDFLTGFLGGSVEWQDQFVCR